MKIKNKGKVHPSPSSSSSSSPSDPILSTLHLLPPTILSLASVLPPHDLQVLSYLLALSLHHSNTRTSSPSHRSSSFDCDCFDCYTVYWLRWDSSPNRNLIHRVIDAFEDHLSSSSPSAAGKSKVGRRRGKDRNGSRDKQERSEVMTSRGNVSSGGGAQEAGDDVDSSRENKGCEENDDVVAAVECTSPGSPLPDSPPLLQPTGGGSRGGGDHKGLARKVLPDVLGILNSRLWNLWSPDV